MAGRMLVLRGGDSEYHVKVDESQNVTIDQQPALPVRLAGDGEMRVGQEPAARLWAVATGDTRWVFADGEVYELEVQEAGRRRTVAGVLGSLSAPMPASVVRVEVAPGDHVRKGDALIVLEAMKMELPVRAPADGVVKSVHCQPGDLVKPGAPLIDLE